MRREKRTIYLMPDLAQRVDETAAVGGVSPSAVVETALDEHFAQESMFSVVEALTRCVGELDEKITTQQTTLTKMEAAIGALGRGLMAIKEMLLKPHAAQVEQPQPVPQEREP